MNQVPKTKEYVRPMPPTWWLERPAYTKFMVREVASLFIALYCIFLLVLLYRANQGPDAFAAFYKSLTSPLSFLLHLVALFFAVFHAVTFFNLTPRAIVVFRGDEKVPDTAIAGGHYALWAVVSVIVIVIALLA